MKSTELPFRLHRKPSYFLHKVSVAFCDFPLNTENLRTFSDDWPVPKIIEYK